MSAGSVCVWVCVWGNGRWTTEGSAWVLLSWGSHLEGTAGKLFPFISAFCPGPGKPGASFSFLIHRNGYKNMFQMHFK